MVFTDITSRKYDCFSNLAGQTHATTLIMQTTLAHDTPLTPTMHTLPASITPMQVNVRLPGET